METTNHNPSSIPVTSTTTESVPTPVPPATLVVAPPVGLSIPQPPKGWDGTTKADQYRGVKPNHVELLTLEDAAVELAKFTDYPATLGKTAPRYDEALSVFDAASKWSTMRTASAAWDNYCAVQEGIVWTQLRDQLSRIKPAFTLAVRGDPSMTAKYGKLTSLLAAKTTIARKGAVTRKLNKLAKAKGEPATHGAAGKRRKRADEKALAAKGAQAEAAAGNAASVATKPVVTASIAAQPVVATSTAQPAVNGSNGSAVNGTNGAAHA